LVITGMLTAHAQARPLHEAMYGTLSEEFFTLSFIVEDNEILGRSNMNLFVFDADGAFICRTSPPFPLLDIVTTSHDARSGTLVALPDLECQLNDFTAVAVPDISITCEDDGLYWSRLNGNATVIRAGVREHTTQRITEASVGCAVTLDGESHAVTGLINRTVRQD